MCIWSYYKQVLCISQFRMLITLIENFECYHKSIRLIYVFYFGFVLNMLQNENGRDWSYHWCVYENCLSYMQHDRKLIGAYGNLKTIRHVLEFRFCTEMCCYAMEFFALMTLFCIPCDMQFVFIYAFFKVC